MNIWLLLGLKPENFRAGMKRAIDDTKEFEKGWKGLAKIIAGGAVAGMIIGFLRSMATEAQATRKELEEMGRPIPQSVNALATLGDAFEGFGRISSTVVGTVLGGWQQLFDVIGSGVNRLRGIGEAQENIAKAAAKVAEQQEAALARARAENSPEKIKAAQKDLDDYRRKASAEGLDNAAKSAVLLKENLRLRELVNTTDAQTLVGIKAQKDLEENIVALRRLDTQDAKERADARSKADREAVQAAKQHTAEVERLAQAKFEGLTIDKQIEALDRSRSALESNIRDLKRAGLDTTTEEADLAEVLNALTSKRKELTNQVADAQERARRAAEGQAEAARKTQEAYEAMLFGMTNGGASSQDINQASDQTLAEMIRRNNQQLIAIKGSPLGANPGGGNDITADFNILRLSNENKRLQGELDLRNGLRNDVGFFGVEGARTQFKGDPLVFDRLVEQFTNRADQDAEQTRLLRDIRADLRPMSPEMQRIADLLDRGVDTNVHVTGVASSSE